MKSEIAERNITVHKDLSTDLGQILFDRGQIRQALTNLVLNACESMPDGGTLNVTTRTNTNMVELSITDTGYGIAAESLDHIFDSFYSTKSSGTGLGLPLVRQICLAHGGDVRCADTSERGTTFIITLPGQETAS